MSTVEDFNVLDNCDKIPAECVNAYLEYTYDSEEDPTALCVESSWGGGCLDLTELVRSAESCTTLYLSPEENPNCLVYEPEEKCGDNVCINGDDLSRIISMKYLKDVDQTDAPSDGDVYIFNGTTGLFEPYDLKTAVQNINTAIQNIRQTIANHENRIQVIETKLTPPADAPSDVKVVFGNVNDYADPNAVVSAQGVATTLDKTHGLYTHLLADEAYGDQIFG